MTTLAVRHISFRRVVSFLLEDGNERRRERALAEQTAERFTRHERERERAGDFRVAHERR
jgi:hypothetical protein